MINEAPNFNLELINPTDLLSFQYQTEKCNGDDKPLLFIVITVLKTCGLGALVTPTLVLLRYDQHQ